SGCGSLLSIFSAFFAFLRILARSTMHDLLGRGEAMLAGGGSDARGVDALRVVAEGVQQRGGGQRVDQARDAAAHGVDALHRRPREGVSSAAGDADAMLDVVDRLGPRERAEAVAKADALAQRR